jgi:hypothetical protein
MMVMRPAKNGIAMRNRRKRVEKKGNFKPSR